MNEKLCPSRQRGVIKSFSLPAHREIPRKEMPQSCANLVSRWKDDKVIPMKSHWALIALLIAIHTGCGNVVTTEKAVRNEDMLTAKRLQVLDAFAEAWNRHDIEVLMSVFAPAGRPGPPVPPESAPRRVQRLSWEVHSWAGKRWHPFPAHWGPAPPHMGGRFNSLLVW